MSIKLLKSAVCLSLFVGIAAACCSAQDYTWARVMPPAGPLGIRWIRYYDNPCPLVQFRITRNVPGSDNLTSFCGSSAATANGMYIYPNDIPFNEVEKVQLWHDANNNKKADQGETALSEFIPDASNWDWFSSIWFSNFSLACPQGDTFILMTITMKPNPTTWLSMQMTFYQSTSTLGFSGGSTFTGPSSTSAGPYYTRTDHANLTMGPGLAVPAANALQGTVGHPILQFKISQDGQGITPVIDSITINPNPGNGHTALPADITQLRLYREVNIANGVVDQADILIGTGVKVSAGAAAADFIYSFTYPINIDATTVNFLVVADIASNAGNGRVFRMVVNPNDVSTETFFLDYNASVTEDLQTILRFIAGSESLFIVNQPVSTTAGAFLTAPTGMRIEVRLTSGAVDANFTGPIYCTIETGPGGGNFTPNSTSTIQAAAGVATFAATALDKVGTYSLRFSAAPMAAVVSNSFNISHGAPYKIFIDTQPSNGTAGAALSPAPAVHVEDAYANLCTTFGAQITANLLTNPGGSTLSGGQVNASGGLATFPSLSLNRPGLGYSLSFSSPGVAASSQSNTFAIQIGPAAQLQFFQQPTNANGGAFIVPAPRLQVQDAGGNAIVGYTGDMTVAIQANPGGGTLSGTTSVAVAASFATFSDLSINLAGNGYTLLFSINAPGVGVITKLSNTFSIAIGAAATLKITRQPDNSTGGIAFSSQPKVEIQDAGGNTLPTDSFTVVTATITSGTGEPGSQLWGTAVLTATAGVCDFVDLAVTKAGPNPYTLSFSATGFGTAISSSFIISIGILSRVTVSTQPSGASFAQQFAQQPVAQLTDYGGNLISSASATVSVAIKAGTGTNGANLTGNVSVPTSGGVATFTNLAIDIAGVDFVLTFSGGGLQDGDSVPFNVASEATQIGVALQPGLGQIGLLLSVQPIVEVRDANGTLFTGDNFTLITVEIASGTGTVGASLSGTTSLFVMTGVAAFTDLKINTPGVGYRLKFTSYPSLTPAFSEAFDVAGIAVKLKVTRQPVGNNPGEPLAVQPRVEVADFNGVRCMGENGTMINAYITPATGTEHAIMSGSNPIVVVNGIADYTDLAIDRPGIGYTLSFSSSPSMLPTTSAGLTIVGQVGPGQGNGPGITSGADGGTCSAQASSATPWAVLAAMLLICGLSIRRRSKTC